MNNMFTVHADSATHPECCAPRLRVHRPIAVVVCTLAFLCIVALIPASTLAQQVGNPPYDNNQVDIVRMVFRFMRSLLYVGFVFVFWSISNLARNRPYGKQVVWALGCFAFSLWACLLDHDCSGCMIVEP